MKTEALMELHSYMMILQYMFYVQCKRSLPEVEVFNVFDSKTRESHCCPIVFYV